MDDLSELRSRYFSFAKEVDLLTRTWHAVLVLNRNTPTLGANEVYQLTQRTAPTFFALLKLIFARELTLGLCRLSEKAKTTGGAVTDSNLGVDWFLTHHAVKADRAFHEALANAFAPLKGRRRELRKVRNKHLGHLDDFHAVSGATGTIPTATFQQGVHTLNLCVELLARFLNQPSPQFEARADQDICGVWALVAALRQADPGPEMAWTSQGPVDRSRLTFHFLLEPPPN